MSSSLTQQLAVCLLLAGSHDTADALVQPVVHRATPRAAPRRAAPPLLLTALPRAALGGAFAGGLHAISGPDHLAALLPLCVGRRWYRAAGAGALWGIGHGVGAAMVGALGFVLRGALNLEAISAYMEVAVGISLVVIGYTGVRESREWADDVESCVLEPLAGTVECADTRADQQPPQRVTKTLLSGVFNGISGTGHVLGVMPALAMPNWLVAGAYLGSFGVGTFVAMAIFTGIAGELSSRMGTQLDNPSAPANLAMGASVVALVMGAVWIWRAAVELGLFAVLLRAARRG